MPAGGGLSCPTELVITAGCPPAPPQNCSLTDCPSDDASKDSCRFAGIWDVAGVDYVDAM